MVVSLASANFWVGGFRLSSSGGSKPWTGQWKWSDNSPFNYYNWYDGAPNNDYDFESNIMVYTADGKWNDDRGSKHQWNRGSNGTRLSLLHVPKSYVCEYKLRYIHL